MKATDNQKEIQIYNTEELAVLLDVTADWLYRNRSSHDPIPYKKIGRLVCYIKSDVQEWIGKKDLKLQFYSTKTLAKKIGVSTSWLKHNRPNDNHMPFRRFGKLIRYQNDEIMDWIKKNNPAKEMH